MASFAGTLQAVVGAFVSSLEILMQHSWEFLPPSSLDVDLFDYQFWFHPHFPEWSLHWLESKKTLVGPLKCGPSLTQGKESQTL